MKPRLGSLGDDKLLGAYFTLRRRTYVARVVSSYCGNCRRETGNTQRVCSKITLMKRRTGLYENL